MINYSLILTTNYAGKQWSLVGNSYDGLEWNDSLPKPTQAELDSQWDAVQAYVDAHAYIAKRASEYPPITDFADAYYWAQKGNTALMDAYVAKCDAIKLKYPK